MHPAPAAVAASLSLGHWSIKHRHQPIARGRVSLYSYGMSMDRGVLDQQLQALGDATRWWNQRELRDLPAVLSPDEEIAAISRGRIGRVRWARRQWLIIITDRRLLCLRSGGRATWRQVEIPGEEIKRVALRVGPLKGRVIVVTTGHTYRLLVPRTDAYKLNTALSVFGAEKLLVAGFAPVRVVRTMIDHVLALPAIALDPNAQLRLPPPPAESPATDERIRLLEAQIQELRDQVHFLEQLLVERKPSLTAGSIEE